MRHRPSQQREKEDILQGLERHASQAGYNTEHLSTIERRFLPHQENAWIQSDY